MKRALIAAALVVTIISPAWADDDFAVPGTNIKRPPTDVACDKAFDDGDYAAALPLCIASAKGYRVIVDGITPGDPAPVPGGFTMGFVRATMEYDMAFTLFQIAFSKHKQSSDGADGAAEGKQAYLLYRDVHDGYWERLNAALGRPADDHEEVDIEKYPADVQAKAQAALTPSEATLAGDFVALMMRVHAVFPTVFADEAKLQNNSNGDT